MKIYFTDVKVFKRAISKSLNFAVEYLNEPERELEMSLSFVSPDEIRTLNASYRGVDAVTDVLSFPAFDNLERSVLDLESFGSEALNPQTGRLHLGDVIICLDRAKEQAESYGHDLKRELCFLSLHGLLHLLGYDHENETDERQMFSLQEEILSKCGVKK